jgi:methyl-accepting chemotaxis protein
MSLFNARTLASKLLLGYVFSCLILFALAAVSLRQTQKMNATAMDLSENWMPSVQTLGELSEAANDVRRAGLRSVLEEDPERKREAIKKDFAKVEDYAKVWHRYQPLITSPEERALADEIDRRWSAYVAVNKAMMEAAEAGESRFSEARKLAGQRSVEVFANFLTAIERAIAINRAGGAESARQAHADYRTAIFYTLAALGIGVPAVLGTAWYLIGAITRPIFAACAIAENVAKGNLMVTIPVGGNDETAVLMRSLNDMNGALRAIVRKVRDSSESIAVGASEISAGNTDLSQRTERQAASLGQTASSMDQLTATVKNNTEGAEKGNKLAHMASQQAQEGGMVVAEVVATMKGIADSSRHISDIISVIESIAFQTNILALNAAVEAARAGEDGRGFAVVAGEVRMLAKRSADAAKEIKALIFESVKRVDAGSVLVSNAGTSIGRVVQSVQQVAEIMGEITAASREQLQGIEQINKAVAEMDGVTQQNAALVEEAAAAAQSMAAQSASMTHLVQTFRIDS